MAICPNCGNQTGEGAVFCDRCGTRLPQPEAAVAVQGPAPAPAGGSVICPACGAGNVPGEAFCDFCGSPLQAPSPVIEAVVPPEAAPAAVAAGPAPAVGGPPACPVCGTPVQPDEAFCSNCGASLAQPPIPPEPVPEVEAAPVAQPTPSEPVAAAPAAVAVVEPAAPLPLPTAAPAPLLTCPACGAEVEAGDTFCSTCGASLKAAPAPAPVVQAAPPPGPAPVVATPPPPAPVAQPAMGPRLVVVATGAEIPLPPGGEILIGREDPISGVYPGVDLTPHGGEDGGVSRRHARLIFEGGRYSIEDLDSTNFTFVNKQKLAPRAQQPLNDGDEIRCGRVALVLRAK